MRWMLIVLLGCSGQPAPAKPTPVAVTVDAAVAPADAPLDRDLPRLADRGVALFEEVAQALQTAGEDCAKAAALVGQLQRTYADVTTANRTVLREGRAKELRAALAPHDARLDAAAKAIMQSPAMARCAEDKAFSNAFDELVGAPP